MKSRDFSISKQRRPFSGLTPKLSRAAAGREAHGKLYLPCGLRPDVGRLERMLGHPRTDDADMPKEP